MVARELFVLMIVIAKFPISPVKTKKLAPNVNYRETGSCDEFSSDARFNPYSVLNDYWFAFYSWSPSNKPCVLQFMAPTSKESEYLRNFLNSQVQDPIYSNATMIIMKDITQKVFSILVRRGDEPNSPKYWLYYYQRLAANSLPMIPEDFRFKQTSDNKYLGIMACQANVVFVMSRRKDVPPKRLLQEEASKLGYHSRGGKSYLYQGHQWMPIPEMSEDVYWMSAREKSDPKNNLKHLWD